MLHGSNVRHVRLGKGKIRTEPVGLLKETVVKHLRVEEHVLLSLIEEHLANTSDKLRHPM